MGQEKIQALDKDCVHLLMLNIEDRFINIEGFKTYSRHTHPPQLRVNFAVCAALLMPGFEHYLDDGFPRYETCAEYTKTLVQKAIQEEFKLDNTDDLSKSLKLGHITPSNMVALKSTKKFLQAT
jgi:hypothetical protein